MDTLVLFLAIMWLCLCILGLHKDQDSRISGYTLVILGFNTSLSMGIVVGILLKSFVQVFGG